MKAFTTIREFRGLEDAKRACREAGFTRAPSPGDAMIFYYYEHPDTKEGVEIREVNGKVEIVPVKNSKESCIEMGKSYRTKDGKPVRVLCIDRKSEDYPVAGFIEYDGEEEFRCWTACGRFLGDEEEHEYDLVEVSPYDRFKINDPIWVRTFDDEWKPRHFAGIDLETGQPLAWDNGLTSHTVWNTESESCTSAWREARLACEFTP